MDTLRKIIGLICREIEVHCNIQVKEGAGYAAFRRAEKAIRTKIYYKRNPGAFERAIKLIKEHYRGA